MFNMCGLRTGDETREEGLLLEVSVVLLEVLTAGRAELQSNELEAGTMLVFMLLQCHSIGNTNPRFSKREMMGPTSPRW